MKGWKFKTSWEKSLPLRTAVNRWFCAKQHPERQKSRPNRTLNTPLLRRLSWPATG